MQEINEALRYSSDAVLAAMLAYKEVGIPNEEKNRKMRLVTTSREHGCLLKSHSDMLEAALGSARVLNEFDRIDAIYGANQEIDGLPHLAMPFRLLPEDPNEQFETELPHPATRVPPFPERFFSISH